MAQNSRRGRSGRRRQGGGGNNPNRSMDSQGPEVKIRGNAQQIYDKYTGLARDAFSSGDRVRGESLQQHAEHYYRLLQAMQPDKKPEQDQANQNAGPQGDAQRPPKDEQAARDGQGRRQNKDREESDVAARSSDEPPRMDGAEQAATDDAQGSGQGGPEVAEEAPKRRRRRRTRRDEADGEDQGESTSKASGDAPAKDTETAAKAPEEASA